ncbi:MCE family protein [Nocardia farcinica]|uniref:Virulence factor Mce family protein n=2 Tax=Nocardia TaxID=1817 RepID=A0A0H5NWJ0_NOCFR|nr:MULTISPECIES: MCE family protein [Nocardia]AXK86723.1 MCE family protein [Nocardia farcinica]MBA4857112.1 MCE family protein [Nocardia farcinica]MBC9817189.1 MCE family protein [Nocardia farcinica]MBF6070327.1 MCE family protein [Nocardia farcinica]MBF6138854.1 MCE family protein [Nocardia farcinica]
MADSKQLRDALGLKLAGLAMVLALVAIVAVALTMFVGGFTRTATVLVQAPRSGLVLDPDAKVKVRGVEIGKVAAVRQDENGATLELALDPEKLKLVPANAGVDIRSTTVFGAKYVNFVVPQVPSSDSLRPGATVVAEQVTVEFNTLFQHLSDVLAKLEPQKLNATLAALGQALQGRGQTLGTLLADLDVYLREMNPTLPTLREDLRATADVSHLYADTVGDLLRTVDNAVVTSQTLVDEQSSLDDMLANLTGLADTTGSVLRENEQNLGTALDLLRPTTALLDEYAPGLNCMINAVANLLPVGEAVFGGNQPGVAMNTNFMFGAEPYTYPDDLPKVNATGGPRCEGLVDRVPGSHANYVVTDTSEGGPYVPSMELKFNGPKVFQLLFAGLPGVSAP